MALVIASLIHRKALASFRVAATPDGVSVCPSPSPPNVPAEPWQMCTHPTLRVVYVTLRDDGLRVSRRGGYSAVAAYDADTWQQVGAPAGLERDAVYASTDRTGRFLFTAHQTASTNEEEPAEMRPGMVVVHALRPDGAVISPPIQRVETLKFAHCVAVAPDNRFVYVSHVAPSSAIAILAFDLATGSLTLSSWFSSGDVRHLAFHPVDERVMYGNDQFGLSLRVFRVDPLRGGLKERQAVATLPANHVRTTPSTGQSFSTATVRVHHSGRVVLVTNRGDNSLSCFPLAADGSVSGAAQRIPTGPGPRVLAVMNDDDLIFTGSDNGTAVSIFRLHLPPSLDGAEQDPGDRARTQESDDSRAYMHVPPSPPSPNGERAENEGLPLIEQVGEIEVGGPVGWLSVLPDAPAHVRTSSPL